MTKRCTFKRCRLRNGAWRTKKVMPDMMAAAANIGGGNLPDPLAVAEEMPLIIAWQECGSEDALETLIRHNMRFAMTISAEYTGNGIDSDDLIQEARIGMMIAATRFDCASGHRFITYAIWWIRQRLQMAIDNSARQIRIPVNKERDTVKVRRAVDGGSMTPEQIADVSGVAEGAVKDILAVWQSPLSIDSPLRGNDGEEKTTLGGSLVDDRPLPDDDLFRVEQIEFAAKLVACLPPRQASIIVARFGLNGREPRTLAEIGDDRGISRERVRQLINKSLLKMHKVARKMINELDAL